MHNDKRIKRKVRRSYIVSTVSISLVLFLLGSVGYMLSAALTTAHTLRRSITLSAELDGSIDERKRGEIERSLKAIEGVEFVEYSSKEEKIDDGEFRRMFAAEIEEILAENPLRNSFEVAVAIGSDGQATVQKNIGGANVDADVTVDETTGHVNVFVRNSGNEITAAEVHISPRWGVITIENIMVADTDESHSFKRTGIDVMQGVIDLIADKVNFKNADGTVGGKVSIDAVKGTLITQDAVLRGNLFLPYTRITQDNWQQFGTYNAIVGTTYNLLGEIAGKSEAGLNLQIEYIQTPSDVTNLGHVRLPDLTGKDPDSWVGCEVNILNDTTTNPLYVRGTPNGNNFGLAKWSGGGWNSPNHNVGINPGCEGKFKLIKTSINGSSTAYYLWICCYANLNQ
jgi:hypothetical protein